MGEEAFPVDALLHLVPSLYGWFDGRARPTHTSWTRASEGKNIVRLGSSSCLDRVGMTEERFLSPIFIQISFKPILHLSRGRIRLDIKKNYLE